MHHTDHRGEPHLGNHQKGRPCSGADVLTIYSKKPRDEGKEETK